MLTLIPLLWRRLEFASVACVSLSFWALAVLVHVKLQGGVLEAVVLGAMLLCCLLLLGFVSLRRWRSMGTPGLLLLASIASYLFISSMVSLANGSELLARDLTRLGFFLVVTLAAILGGRWLLDRIGVEATLKWTLALMTASCAIVLASPLLRDIGVLPEYRLPYRLTGVFSDPNDAGFIACATVALALAFQFNGRQRFLGFPALVLGCAAGLATFSYTAAAVLVVILVFFLLLNVRRLRRDLLHTGLTVLCLGVVLVWLIPGTRVVFTSEAWIVDAYDDKQVGEVVTVFLVNDKSHRADDDPVQPWRWQRADAHPGDISVPDDATWNNITGALSPSYTPVDEDEGKFLRAYVSYEKNGLTRRAQTQALGPIMPASVGTEAGNPLRGAGDIVETARGKDDASSGSGRTLSLRLQLWETGFNKVMESPIVGHGLHRFHYMEGAPIGNQGRPAGVHNQYLMLFGEAGVLPLALYLLSLLFLVRLLWTAPKSLARDSTLGWVVVMAVFGVMFHHLLTMGAYNFVIGLACAIAAFLLQGQRGQGQGQRGPRVE